MCWVQWRQEEEEEEEEDLTRGELLLLVELDGRWELFAKLMFTFKLLFIFR